MSKNYDNWERLVEAVLKREKLRQLARESSSSSISSTFISELATPNHDDQNFQLESSSSTVNEKDLEALLISDCEDNISISENRVAYATKEQQYFRLWDSTATLLGRSKKFYLDDITEKCYLDDITEKCYMIRATELIVSCSEYTSEDHKLWTFRKDSRFSMVAEFRNVRRLDIRGKIEGFYSKTRYGAYLVFKLGKNIRGLGSAKGIIKFVKYDEDVDAEKRATIVYLQPNKDGNGQTAVRRLDGWMEIELGKFYYDLRDNGPVEARLLGNNFNTKVDIIVAGIELRMRGDTREFMRY